MGTASVNGITVGYDDEGAGPPRARAQRPDYTGLLAHASVPTLVVVGRDDEFTRWPPPSSWRSSSGRRTW